MPPASSRPPWRLREADLGTVERLARGGNLPRPVARMLAARGHEDPARVSAHLEASLRALHDPRLLEGIGPASERIARALRDRETILIHGDYDVDGVTGTALLSRLFQLVGARSQWFIPNRFVHGYSFGPHSLEMARKHQARVVVSVDNGTSAAATIAELAAEGVDTIVTDHHEPPAGPLPIATAIVNPKLAGSSYPFRELCGAGVAFKLAWGVAQEISGARRVRDDLRLFLADAMSYVAIATVCDVVPLVDENRILARRGLSALEQTSNPGLRALLEVAQLDARTLLAEDVGFKLGPRLNASGRLGSAETAVETLLAPNLAEARRLAAQLDRMNDERRAIEGKLLGEALLECERFSDAGENPVLVVAGQGWHQGVVGVIAARLVERHRRPALVIGLDGPTGRGSARSVAGFSMLEALHGGAAHMLKYGGHAAAAGCEVRADSVDLLREAINARAREMLAGLGHASVPLWLDAEVPLGAMTSELMRVLDRLEPFGAQNEKPLFLSRETWLCEPPRVVGADRSHLMLRVRHGASEFKAMAFGMASRIGEMRFGVPFQMAYTPRWNTFRGETNLELFVRDVAPAADPGNPVQNPPQSANTRA
ncbi:MAG: single-stranded-DNA-specific exonuclease RecJ [Planctomycetes bacterium]|nr:single-stranded-DNA-specific exonuclease RecJ [Planctomycetota bacterium]